MAKKMKSWKYKEKMHRKLKCANLWTSVINLVICKKPLQGRVKLEYSQRSPFEGGQNINVTG